MLGQHPQLYGLPESQLFTTATLAEKFGKSAKGNRLRGGLLRLIAQLIYGEQTFSTVELAREWLRRRAHYSTGYVFELLASRVYPLIPVEKSPDIVYSMNCLERTIAFFPRARFIHLLRHPRSYCESNVRYYQRTRSIGKLPPAWLFCANDGTLSPPAAGSAEEDWVLDPQRGWYMHNRRIREFLAPLPEDQHMWVRGEELLTEPDQTLHRIAEWLGLRCDAEAIDEMKHPERSDYAFIGPTNAPYGNSRTFLEDPTLRPELIAPQSLEEPLPWREDRQGFFWAVKHLASQFGYR
jgi:hypothetical protein